jgi:c-di-GMP-binding flagellar brake protein YcgR
MASPFSSNLGISIQIPEINPGKWFPTKVLSYAEDREVVVAVPTEHGDEVIIPPEYKVLLELVLPDGLRRMTAYVVARKAGLIPGLVLDWPQSEEKIQRRDSVRVAIMFPVYVRPIAAAGLLTRVNGNLVDLSAGGARILVPTPQAEGGMVNLALQLPIGELIVSGRIIRAMPSPTPAAPSQYALGVQFTEVTEVVRREITKFVFDTQREHHRRGAV